MTFSEKYAELIALSKLYILQEFSPKDWKNSEPEAFQFFKQYAQQARTQTPSAPVISAPETSNVPPVQSTRPLTPPPTPPQIVKQTPVPTPLVQKEKPKAKEIKQEPAATDNPKPSVGKAFELQPLPSPEAHDLSDIKQILRERFPSQSIVEKIPGDEEAKKISNQWKQAEQPVKVIVVTGEMTALNDTILSNMTNAIHSQLVPASIVSAANLSDEKKCEALINSQLQLIIVSATVLQSLPHLKKHYHEDAQQKKQYLGNIPLCLIAETSEFTKNPKLKVSLWSHLKQILDLSHGT
jgi:hypothetical protein